VTLILHTPTIYISVERSFDKVIMELGFVGLVLWIMLGLSTAITAWKAAKNIRATLWVPLDFFMLLFPIPLFSLISSLSFYARQDSVIKAHVSLVTHILSRLRTFPKAIELTLAEATPRQA
jgi:hypothetical protein